MAIKLGDNLDYKGSKPDFSRQQYETKEAMTQVKDAAMPQLYLAYCLEDHKIYLYDKTNDIDPITGHFRVFESGSGNSAQVTEMPETNAELVNTIVQYVGETDGNYTKGYFYLCADHESSEEVAITTVEGLKEAIAASNLSVPLKIGDTEENTNAILKNGTYYFVYEDVIYSGVLSNVIIQTLETLKEIIEDSKTTVNVDTGDSTLISTKSFVYNGITYFVYEDNVYSGTESEGTVVLSEATVITTDETVEELNIIVGQIIDFNLETATKYETDEAVAELNIYVTEISHTYQWDNISVSPSSGEPATITTSDIDELFD